MTVKMYGIKSQYLRELTVAGTKVEVGNIYRFEHSSKQSFVAKVTGIGPAWEGDEVDDHFVYVIYDVRAGTDQAYLSTKPEKENVRESALRPSKISGVSKHEGGDWLREVKSEKRAGLMSRLRKVG